MRSPTSSALAFLLLAACPSASQPMTRDAEPAVDAIAGADVVDADAMDAEFVDAVAPDASDDAGDQRDAEVVDADQPDAGIAFDYWANTQWPPYLTLAEGARATVYGQLWISGETQTLGPTSGIEAELGWGAAGSEPSTWTWIAAAYNIDVGNNDEYFAELTAPAPGAYDYAFRYRYLGSPWIVADRTDGARCKMAVREPNAILRVATLNLHCINDDPIARIDAAIAGFTALGTDLIALQEVCEGAPISNSAEYLAQQLSASTGRSFWHRFVQTHLASGMTPEGVGIVGALPLAEAITLELPVADFPRKSIIAIVSSPIGMVAFATAHLSYRPQDAQARLDQARALIAEMDRLGGTDLAAAIVAGDYNSTPVEPPPAEMIAASFFDAFASAHPAEDGFTHSATNPNRRIDYIFASSIAPWSLEIGAAQIEFDQPYAPGSYVSDHLGLSAQIIGL